MIAYQNTSLEIAQVLIDTGFVPRFWIWVTVV
jgi:hypothetical protein